MRVETPVQSIRMYAALAAAMSLTTLSAHAATLATGDSRVVTQPGYPAVCMTLKAGFTAAQRNTPPTADDTSRLQSALNYCAGTGKSVVLAASGSDNAFYSGPLNINGAALVIDEGVTLYGNDSYSSNHQFIAFTGTNAALMGPGTVDGRGDLIGGTARLVQATKITNFIAYNVTLREARFPNLYVEGGEGFTAWGIVIRTPATRHEADGIDIDSVTNATVMGSSVEAGDDGIAVKTNSGDATNITIANTRFYGTHGLSIGSIDANTVSNVLFNNNYVYGLDLQGNPSTFANAINIKTGPCSLNVNRVSYLHTCIKQASHLIVMRTNYNSCTTGGNPSISDIVVNGVYATQSNPNAYTSIVGSNASSPIQAILANVSLDANAQSNDQYADIGVANSSDIPSGVGIKVTDVSMSGSVPVCQF